jgi:catechol 2,3-dioxygenase-like lactoylglutathione lyase family enzyme
MQISSAIAQLRTTDMTESIRFYTDTVGLKLVFSTRIFMREFAPEISFFN